MQISWIFPLPAAFLHLIFPTLVASNAYELFYSRIGQHTSVGNYWNDPHQRELYLKYSTFLPYVNNEVLSTNSTQFRNNLLKLEKMILIGGPNDGGEWILDFAMSIQWQFPLFLVITPWESAHFGFYDENLEVVPLRDRQLYKEDSIGLRELDDDKKLELVSVPHIIHMAWHLNRTLIDEVIVPHLDWIIYWHMTEFMGVVDDPVGM